jgi:hypothetical protein
VHQVGYLQRLDRDAARPTEHKKIKKTHYKSDNKVKTITLVWASTENGRKWNSLKGIIYESGNNRIER